MIFMKKITTRLLSLVLLGAFIPSFVLAETWDLGKGDITVTATEANQTVSQKNGETKDDPDPVITSSGKTENTVTINAEANATAKVTLENVNIDVSSNSEAAITTQGQGDVTLNLLGNNSVQSGTYHAGVHKENTGNLTVTAPEGGTGSLNATGGQGGAGIGGGSSSDRDNGNNITISGGTIVARGGEYSAGIGGGGGSNSNNASNITISGGNVTANGSGSAAGIGGGNGGSGTDIEITGGIVAANGGEQGAGIGGGKYGNGSGITVSGGTVNATGKDNVYGGGAGIGGGSGGNGSDITISGGEVTANGGKVTANGGIGGAGIGGGNGGSGNGITVSGGEVTAKGGTFGAGIGGGGSVSGQGNGSNIKIDGGQVTAQGGLSGAGIGGGQSSNGSGIKISGDAQVKAQGGAKGLLKEGAAIGNGGTDTQKGDELDMDQVASGLSVDGFIQTYKPDDNIDTAKPENLTIGTTGEHSWNEGTVTTQPTCTTEGVKTYTCTNTAHTSPITKTESIPALNHDFKTYIYDNNATCTQDGTETAKCDHGCGMTDTRTKAGSKLTGNTAETAVEARQDAYWVSGTDGRSLPYQSQVKDGVLTVTVQADTASLRGTTESLRQLEAQGITGIRFVTNKAQSDFTLSDLLSSGTGSFTLTHDGDKVTFTLESTDISGILK